MVPSSTSRKKQAAWLPILGSALAMSAFTCAVPHASAQQADMEALSPRILFVVSGGFWQTLPEAEDGDESAAADGETGDSGEAGAATGDAEERGYYRALAYRSDDDTSRLYLQRIALGADGPAVVESSEITQVTERAGYITDIRPENSSGVSAR